MRRSALVTGPGRAVLVAAGIGASLVVAGMALAADNDDADVGGPHFQEASATFTRGGVVSELRVVVEGEDVAGAEAALSELIERHGLVPDAETSAEQGAEPGVHAAFATFALWEPGEMPVPVEYNFSEDPEGLPLFEPVMHAIETWNGVEGSSFRFEYTGETDREACDFEVGTVPNGDGHNVVKFGDFSGLGENFERVLGITCSAYDENTLNYIEFDMELSDAKEWSVADETPPTNFDLYTTVLHEFGHAMGLGHTDAPNAVMRGTAYRGKPVRSLNNDDIAAVLSLYGDGSLPGPTPVRGPFRVPVPAIANGD